MLDPLPPEPSYSVDPHPRIDASVAHPARRYNYWLGGKDHFAADRASGDAIAMLFPTIRISAVENRRFLRRAVTYLAADAGVRQFLDIGTGLPAPDNTHDVAQAIAPESRVVYVDNDPMVIAHARALLTSAPQGATAYLDADLRRPATILDHPDLHQVLDLGQPVALLLVAVLHFLTGADQPHRIVADLVNALAPGSYLVLSHATADHLPPHTRVEIERLTSHDHTPFQARSLADIEAFVQDLQLVEPGLVNVAEWRAGQEPTPRPTAAQTAVYGAVARIP